MKSFNLKTLVISVVVALLLGLGIGRYSNRQAPNVTTNIDKTKVTDVKTDINTHKVTTVTETPKGDKVTTITEDTKAETKRDTTSDTKVAQSVVAPKSSIINISGLVALDTSRGFVPVYGISANKELIGPVTVGAFGLTNGVIGLSIGINF